MSDPDADLLVMDKGQLLAAAQGMRLGGLRLREGDQASGEVDYHCDEAAQESRREKSQIVGHACRWSSNFNKFGEENATAPEQAGVKGNDGSHQAHSIS